MHVLITGGAGFIGANLCRALLATPDIARITVLDDLSTGFAANLAGLDVELVVGSILDPVEVDRLVARADAVVHLAARGSVPRSLDDPLRTHEVNATGTLQVLQAVRAHGAHLVVSSSSSVYGPGAASPQREDAPPAPASPYAASKLAAESYAAAFQQCFGIDLLTFRFFNVYGPLQSAGHAYAAVIPTFIGHALADEPLTLHGDGLQRRDFTYVDTVTSVLTDAVARRVTAPGPVNLALGGGATVREIAERIEDLVGRPVRIESAPARTGDIRHSRADPARLLELFPGIVPAGLDVGLKATVEWYS